jgi:hypothetical protein
MDRINGAGTVDIGGGKRGFVDENLTTGTEGTEVTALWLNMTQEELAKVIEDAGIVLDPADWTQLSLALAIREARRASWRPVISMTTTVPPGAPSTGDAYLVPAGATGVWAGNEGKIAQWLGSRWSYIDQPDGHGIGLPDGRLFIRIAGSYVEKIALDVQSGKWNYAAVGGTANALTASLTPAPSALAAGLYARLRLAAANTGSMTLNLNGLGVKALNRLDGSAMQPGDIAGPCFADVAYDGAAWQILRLVASDINLQVAANKSPFNLALQSYATRTALSGTGFVNLATGTYTKKSATSLLRVSASTNIFSTGGAGAGQMKVTVGAQSYTVICVNMTSSSNQSSPNGATLLSGLGAGALSWSIAFGRTDALAWTGVVNPNSTDSTNLPTVGTNTSLEFWEIEP